ncbi:FAD-dependent 5-carboxymethylaminomethyl-2-thiouridine(34) oxidoreductase MnmC [Roseateles amylovorans]|uniref:tRNA 5-methylaminomethyl-2-thiouridine biosynthesis bifunctional protein MnmC n=1 Tax=Roseateles amylovorans TaxID=2978473 RepID=A0ABY6B614_9BURK|nr:FAD-dependent 5-carboxymethylaminomethyl-2-thiouridine(34) oxidoreductase MnmC [Roseateles amylovorans]UXH80472.1 FAD-dependent 5-carboxymethylaminomethyl-2-thiouridine(34) oxidoreductase MnmC [Roseateles amylovorans]
MKTAPILPARVDFSDAAVPHAPDFGDVYHARAGAFAQARHVFLAGNGLPSRWSGRPRFVVLETGFGLGNNFLATWAAWRDDPHRSERLVFISIEKHPLTRADLARAHAASPEPALAQQLIDAWPPLTANLHTVDVEGGRVRLMLALGNARDWLHELSAQVDAFYLDGFSPARNPDLWEAGLLKQIGRLAAPGATAATWSVARSVRDGLAAAGFQVEKRPGFASKGEMSAARYAPRHVPPMPPGRQAVAPNAREVLILGAGLAGAACARALTRQGLQCQVLDADAAVASRASGNPGGLFHGTLHADDGPHARFHRAAALSTERELRRLAPALPWLQWGLMRVEPQVSLEAMRALQQRSGLPGDYVQALDASQVSAQVGLTMVHPAWFFPGGGAVEPGAVVRAWLAEAGIQPQLGTHVADLRNDGGRWSALDTDGRVLAQADAVILAAGTANQALAAKWLAGPEWPWSDQRGQLSLIDRACAPPRPAVPVAGVGYALSLPDGTLCFGATTQVDDPDPALRHADQAENLTRLTQLLPGARSEHLAALPLHGRVGWRSLVPDRLPIVGALPSSVPTQRAEQVRAWPRHPGLMICGGLASRGLTWATLCGELIAAQLTGAPWPLEMDLAEALDPARFAARRVRQGG